MLVAPSSQMRAVRRGKASCSGPREAGRGCHGPLVCSTPARHHCSICVFDGGTDQGNQSSASAGKVLRAHPVGMLRCLNGVRPGFQCAGKVFNAFDSSGQVAWNVQMPLSNASADTFENRVSAVLLPSRYIGIAVATIYTSIDTNWQGTRLNFENVCQAPQSALRKWKKL